MSQSPDRSLGIFLVRCYQRTKRLVLPGISVCRFTPTCSQFTIEAIQKYGILKGSWLGLKRILRCNPWHPGGHDPVP